LNEVGSGTCFVRDFYAMDDFYLYTAVHGVLGNEFGESLFGTGSRTN